MNKKIGLFILILVISIVVSGCIRQVNTPVEEPMTGFDHGTVKIIREDVGPSKGGFLNLFMVFPDTLNPLTSRSIYVSQLAKFVFDSLFIENEDEIPEKSLVDRYNISQDGLILDLDLKDNILYHDGEMLTADDVAFTLETIKKAGKKSFYLNQVSNISNVNVLSRLSLRIVLKKPDNNIIKKLTFPIIPRHVFKDWPVEGHSEKMKLIGTGPFMFESYNEDFIKLVRNDSWWALNDSESLIDTIWIDGIIFKLYSADEEMMQAFQRQQIDIAWLEEGELESYSKRADIYINKYESSIMEFMVLSPVGNTNSPFSMESFRSVIIQYLRWYEQFNPLSTGKTVLGRLSDNNQLDMKDKNGAIDSLINEGFNYDDEKNYFYTYKNGVRQPVTISITYNIVNTDRQSMSQWISDALANIGIKVEQEARTYDEQQSLIKSGKFDMMLLGCSLPAYTDDAETMELLKDSLNVSGNNDVILPLYRKYGAVLYHNHIRGARKPVWKNIYNGWHEWYLVHSQP
ncbi:MAG: ABC transporter substrate-binding protein [Acetivibrionales bacterium]